MKKAVSVLIFLVIMMTVFRIGARADSSVNEEYTVTESSGKYVLSKYEGSDPVKLREGALSEILAPLKDSASGARVIFDNISVSTPFEIAADKLILAGAVTLQETAVMTVPEGTSLSLEGFSLTVSEGASGYMRIKGGSVRLSDSYVFGSVLLDYSASSSLTLVSGAVRSSSERAAIDIVSGTANILGGMVESTSAAAISCESGLCLSGAPIISGIGYDIETDRAITLSYEGVAYAGGNDLRVRYLSSFVRGEMTEILYSVTEAVTQSVVITDKEGREYSLSWFGSSEHTEEKNFAAVYLPYSVKIYSRGTVTEVFKLRGERLDEPTADSIPGYNHVGWYLDEEGVEKYTFGEAVSGDISIYSVYRLAAPAFSVASMNVTYDGAPHTLSFKKLTHPLDSAGGFYSYKWFKDGEFIGTAASQAIEFVSDSGTYSCEVTFSYSKDSVTFMAENITVTVKKCPVTPPDIEGKPYNGKLQSPDIYPSTLYAFSETSGTSAGNYPVELKLIDPENYTWENTDESVTYVNFVITKAENFWNEKITVSDIYVGAEIKVKATSAFGSVRYVYSLSEVSGYSATLPTALGKYYVKAIVDGTADYSSLESEALSFNILSECAVGLELISAPDTKDYVAFERFVGAGLSIKVQYNSGRSETVGVDKLSVSYQNGDSFRYGDSGVILGYGGVSISVPVTVSRADYDLSGFEIADRTVVYDGKYHSLDVTSPSIVGADKIPLKIDISGGGSDSGVYDVTVKFSTASLNYNIPDNISVKLTIDPMAVDVLWENLTFVYDGKSKQPIASYTDCFGVTRYPEVSGAAIDAGSSYIASLTSPNKNYSFTNPQTVFVIAKADYDMSGVSWSGGGFVYDGTEKQVEVSGLPLGVSVVGYTDGSATDAGSYTATASLTYDTKNYNSPKALTYPWVIHKAQYDLSGVKFESLETIYDGNIHYPKVTGTPPVGADGIALEYEFSAGATHVADGKVSVRISFSTNSTNYLVPETQTVYVTVKPKGITAVWNIGEYIYDGSAHLPTATAEECKVNVTGAATDAGIYEAVAVSEDPDYYILNAKENYEIKKAENSWVTLPNIGDAFESGSPAPVGEAFSGDTVFHYYKDPEGKDEIPAPTAPGTYYMIAEVEEGKNYLSLISPATEFSIIAVVPIKLEIAMLAGERRAFERLLPEDFTATVSYNDGSVSSIDTSLVRVVYENGDSLRKKDSKVEFIYDELRVESAITVGYADYDMSGAVWENTVSVYDGAVKIPYLTSLPEGVSVIEYIGSGIKAGKYPIDAKFSYDSENYNEPEAPDCTLIIEKQEVEPPVFDSVVYDGKAHAPAISSELYAMLSDNSYINSGEYSVALRLYDGENYRFSGSDSSECNVIFRIEPRVLSVTLEPLKVYLFSEAGNVEYTLTGGEILDGDTVEAEQYIEDGAVYLRSKNPNYTFLHKAGELVEVGYPSPDTMRNIAIIAIIVLIFIILIAVLFVMRARIADFFAVLRCRWKRRRRKATSTTASTESVISQEEPTVIINDVEALNDAPADPPLKSAEEISSMETRIIGVDVEHADELITDSLAKDLVKRADEAVYTQGSGKDIINVDTLSENFAAGDRVDVNALKEKRLLPEDTAYVKVLARGMIDKPLSVYANEFSLSAVKMIALTGGEAVKVVTLKEKDK